MSIEAKNFGTVEYEENDVISFDDGLPGFPDLTRFVMLPGNVEGDLFTWLQSVEDGDIAFVLTDVYQVLPDYNPLVEPEMLEGLLSDELDDAKIEIYNITVVPDDIKQIRVNLKAPIVINPAVRKGRQVLVANEEYGVRHYIFEEIQKAQAISSKTAGR